MGKNRSLERWNLLPVISGMKSNRPQWNTGIILFVALLVLGAFIAGLGAEKEGSLSGTTKLPPSAEPERSALKATKLNGDVERGRYLVEELAKCTECHTPRKENGELDRAAWLRGAPIWILPVKPIANWADRAPALAGFPSFTDEQGERILENGTGPEGETLRPPMHTYHMKPADAKAIIAYLKSLPKPQH